MRQFEELNGALNRASNQSEHRLDSRILAERDRALKSPRPRASRVRA
jgi:hypothetical protein